MPFVRSLAFNLMLYITGVIFGILCLTFWVFPVRTRFWLVTRWNRFALWWLKISCGIQVIITDHNVSPVSPSKISPLTTPHVILSKHQTMWETVFLQYYFSPISTIFKKSLLKLPFFGWGLSLLKPIAIDRTTPLQSLKLVKKLGAQRVKEGFNVLVFPEGTRIPVGQVGTYARSGVEIAKAGNVSVVPVAHNAGECWPAKQFTKYPGEIHVVIGKPIDTSTKASRDIIEEVKEWIEGEIEKMPKGRRP
ncbi:MAG: lysophospholipid acyltransferase family protein [Cellvibrionaceae bacterium]